MKKIYVLLLLIFSGVYLYSAKPQWVLTLGIETNYNKDKYLTGFGIAQEKGKSLENFETAKIAALNDVSGSIRTKIISNLELIEEEKNGEATSIAKVNIQTSVYLELSGIKEYQKYYDRKKRRYYALCVIEKQALLNNFAIKRKELLEEYKSKVSLIKEYIKKNNIKQASNEYLDSNKTLERINQNYLISNFIKDGKENLTGLYKLFKIKGEVYNNIKTTQINSFEDAGKMILNHFNNIDLKNKTFAFIPAFYKTTKISSEFFYYLTEHCTSILEKKGAVLKGLLNDYDLPDYIFKGSFYDTKNGYKVLYSITDTKQKIKLATSEIDLSNEFVKSTGFNILPDNIKIAVKDSKSFSVASLEDTKIQISAWTNKGSENPIFKQGEEVEFYVQVNKSGYISILYHLSGKKRIRTPLIENYYIPPKNIYKPVKISDTFEVYPPYGSETAQIFFSTIPQEPFKTESANIDGEKYDILAEDFEVFLIQKRGLKKKKEQEIAETFISVTTIK